MPLEQSKKNLQPPSLSHLIKDYFRVRREMRESQKAFGFVQPASIEKRAKLKREIFSTRNEMKLVLALASLTVVAGIFEKYNESKRRDETAPIQELEADVEKFEGEETIVVEAMTTAYEELVTANQNQRHLYMDFMGCSILLDKILELRELAIPSSLELEKEAAEIGRGVQATNAMLDQYIENKDPQIRKELLNQQENLKFRIERMSNAISEILSPYMNASLENQTEIQIYLLERLIDLGKRLIAPIPEDFERRIEFDQDIRTNQYLMDVTKAALEGDRETIERIRRQSNESNEGIEKMLDTLLQGGIEKESVKEKFANGLQSLIDNLKEIIIALSRPAVFSEFRPWEEWAQEAQQ